jgi:hypothetical protein
LTRVGDPSREQHGPCRLVDDGEQERPVDAEHLSRALATMVAAVAAAASVPSSATSMTAACMI